MASSETTTETGREPALDSEWVTEAVEWGLLEAVALEEFAANSTGSIQFRVAGIIEAVKRYKDIYIQRIRDDNFHSPQMRYIRRLQYRAEARQRQLEVEAPEEFEKIRDFLGRILATRDETKAATGLYSIDYYNADPMDTAERIKAAADLLSSIYPPDDVRKALEDLAAKAKRESAARAKAKPRAKKRANPELTAARLKAAYEVLVRESDLANPALSNDERLRRAEQLVVTYKRLRRHDPSFHDKAGELKAARRLVNSRNYQSRKARQMMAAAAA